FLNAEDIRQTEVRSHAVVFVIEAGLKGGEKRSATFDEGAKLIALRVAEQSYVGQDERRIFLQMRCVHAIFMHEIEEKTAFEQRIVHAMQKLLHGRVRLRFVEKMRALAHHDAEP